MLKKLNAVTDNPQLCPAYFSSERIYNRLQRLSKPASHRKYDGTDLTQCRRYHDGCRQRGLCCIIIFLQFGKMLLNAIFPEQKLCFRRSESTFPPERKTSWINSYQRLNINFRRYMLAEVFDIINRTAYFFLTSFYSEWHNRMFK